MYFKNKNPIPLEKKNLKPDFEKMKIAAKQHFLKTCCFLDITILKHVKHDFQYLIDL